MNKRILASGGACLLAGLVFPLGSAAQQPTFTVPLGEEGKAVTVTGCLKASDSVSASADATRAPGTTHPGAIAAAPFVLTNIERKEGTETGSAAGHTEAAKLPGTLAVLADPTIKLDAHVNHKVEITGTLNVSGHSRGTSHGTAGSTSPAPTVGASAPMAMTPTLKVKNLRMVADSCS